MKGPVARFVARFAKGELLLFSLLGALCIIFIIVVIVLIGSERNRNTLFAEYEADRAASALFESYRESAFSGEGTGQLLGTASGQQLPTNVVGFGVYTLDGQGLRVEGDAPASISALVPRIEPRLVRFEQRSGTIELVRRLGAMPGEFGHQPRFRGQSMRNRMYGMMRGFGAPPAPPGAAFPGRGSIPAYVFVKLRTRSFFATRDLLTLLLILVPVALAAAMAVVWLLYLRNRRYREKIESQRHLVHLGEIARTLSHEIKNPLGSIRLQTAIMRKIYTTDSPRELTLIEEETDRLTQLVERIGEFLRDPVGTPEPIDIATFLRDLVARFDWKIERLELPAENVCVSFDRGRLRTVLENLMKNAAESGGEATPFSVQVRASRQWAAVSVVDRGSGIPDELREKIFDPFYTTKVKGSGIGLAISKRFVESAGGMLELENAKEGGTEARISLKRIAAGASESMGA